MNALKEFKYSMITFIIAVIFNTVVLFSLYYFFNIRKFPPTYGRDFWVITVLILLALTFFVKKILVRNYDISSSRKSIIIFSSMFCTYMTMLFFLEFLSNYGIKTKEISSVGEIHKARSVDLVIKNFDVINQPIIYSTIISRKKPTGKYAQVFFAYPFISEKKNIFYCIKFEMAIEREADEQTQKAEMNYLLRRSRDTIMKNYDFHKIKNFEYLTKMSSEYNEFSTTVSEKNAIFLKPISETVQKRSNDEMSYCIKGILAVFIGYIAIFLLSRVTNWK
jgi:hypothetical protein